MNREDQEAELIERDTMMTCREDRLQEALQVNINASNDTQIKIRLLLFQDLTEQDSCHVNSEIEKAEAFMEDLKAERLQFQADCDHARAQREDIARFLHEL
ncbi:hypothetical protein Pdw03_8819 [Penicillium digitatum]|uniref:Uncharacterized protein n=1 Tax=Penicillium digitatum TaxID=36651 RepID=A0A7T6XPD7_PENDI|nr:hypothetical protein Pdw03_8819 [Penicillium digitatum]